MRDWNVNLYCVFNEVVYIRKKLEMLSHLKQKKTQRMLLCTWIIELKLDKLNRLGALLQTKRERFSEEETYSYRE
jgi:hypothetical protein